MFSIQTLANYFFFQLRPRMQIFVGVMFDDQLNGRTSKELQISVCSTMAGEQDEYDVDVRL